MRSYTTTQARKYLAEIMDIVMAGEPVIITREEFDVWQEIKQGANFSVDTEKRNQKLLMKT